MVVANVDVGNGDDDDDDNDNDDNDDVGSRLFKDRLDEKTCFLSLMTGATICRKVTLPSSPICLVLHYSPNRPLLTNNL